MRKSREATSSRPADSSAELIETIRHSLVELRRLFQRKELAQHWAAAFGKRSRLDYAELRLLDAVRAGGATVGDVARLLGVDASRASRAVASAVEKGLVRRTVEQSDARKVVLEVTAAGAKLAAKGSELTRNRITLALDDWSRADTQRFARDLARFVSKMT
ncbi:MAG: MarR family transcriptional regulator [Archangium sp.]|nr:MarR family transcriptional regulator [Archangium sp.]